MQSFKIKKYPKKCIIQILFTDNATFSYQNMIVNLMIHLLRIKTVFFNFMDLIVYEFDKCFISLLSLLV